MFDGQSVLITGGTGSFGKKMVRVLLQDYKPRKVIVFSRDEMKQFEMSQKLPGSRYPCLRYFLGDVRDRDRLVRAFDGVDYVIHAAALKQVPAAEYNPDEFVKTNVLGAMNVIEASLQASVKRVIALSTDKACNPINLYGATKLCSDKLFAAANVYSGAKETRFAVVRYGNVLGSRGSVVPFFKERARTGVLPITDARMTRFWITLDQAVHFVIRAIELARGGEIFVPRIASMKVADLATAIAPECRQEIVGIRPGEKLHETLISGDDARNTVEFKECFVIQADPKRREALLAGDGSRPCPEGFAYTSDRNAEWMTVPELAQLVEQIADDYAIEESRWSMTDVPQ